MRACLQERKKESSMIRVFFIIFAEAFYLTLNSEHFKNKAGLIGHGETAPLSGYISYRHGHVVCIFMLNQLFKFFKVFMLIMHV